MIQYNTYLGVIIVWINADFVSIFVYIFIEQEFSTYINWIILPNTNEKIIHTFSRFNKKQTYNDTIPIYE
jgi:hypothetical protein